jgi:hypothetical protein
MCRLGGPRGDCAIVGVFPARVLSKNQMGIGDLPVPEQYGLEATKNQGKLAMELRLAWNDEEEGVATLKAFGELLDAADAHLLSMEAARYDITRAQAKELVRRYAYHPELESWCEDAWALLDIFEEVMLELESSSAQIIEMRPGLR